MADFDIAFEWLMDSEDPKREFASVPDAGGHAIAGINSHWFPTAFARILALPQTARRAEVYNFYLSYFWNPGQFSKLNSNEVAKRVFDAAVNMGGRVAVSLLQRALGPPLEVDGQWGPDTVTAVNNKPEDALVATFKSIREAYYRHLNKPEYLKGWLERCAR